MNLGVLLLGTLLGWSCLLALPWILTGNCNPFESRVGYVMLIPLIIPVWILGETGGGKCSPFQHARFKWIRRNTNFARGKFFVIGVFHGALFSIPSAIMITLVLYHSLALKSVLSFVVLGIAGLMHLILFVTSFVVAVHSVENWGRRIFRSNRKRKTLNA